MANQVSDQLEPWRVLDGKVVMVTGASSGLGREFCVDLAMAGCKVVAAARRIDRLKTLCEEINKMTLTGSASMDSASPRAVAIELDVTADGAAIGESVRKAWDAFGRIDSLVNNAGVRGKPCSRVTVKSSSYLTAVCVIAVSFSGFIRSYESLTCRYYIEEIVQKIQ